MVNVEGRDWLGEAVRLHRLAGAQKEELGDILESRNETIREAIAAGVSMYSIAKAMGLTGAAISKIRDQEPKR